MSQGGWKNRFRERMCSNKQGLVTKHRRLREVAETASLMHTVRSALREEFRCSHLSFFPGGEEVDNRYIFQKGWTAEGNWVPQLMPGIPAPGSETEGSPQF